MVENNIGQEKKPRRTSVEFGTANSPPEVNGLLRRAIAGPDAPPTGADETIRGALSRRTPLFRSTIGNLCADNRVFGRGRIPVLPAGTVSRADPRGASRSAVKPFDCTGSPGKNGGTKLGRTTTPWHRRPPRRLGLGYVPQGPARKKVARRSCFKSTAKGRRATGKALATRGSLRAELVFQRGQSWSNLRRNPGVDTPAVRGWSLSSSRRTPRAQFARRNRDPLPVNGTDSSSRTARGPWPVQSGKGVVRASPGYVTGCVGGRTSG